MLMNSIMMLLYWAVSGQGRPDRVSLCAMKEGGGGGVLSEWGRVGKGKEKARLRKGEEVGRGKGWEKRG